MDGGEGTYSKKFHLCFGMCSTDSKNLNFVEDVAVYK
jgi:hypothetical protein